MASNISLASALVYSTLLFNDQDYTTIKNSTLKVKSGQCSSLSLDVPQGNHKIVVDTSSLPAHCAAKETLLLTDRALTAKDCISFSSTGDCSSTVQQATDLCQKLTTMMVKFPMNATLFEFKGYECQDTAFFIAFRSTCSEDIEIAIKIMLVDFSEEEREFCESLRDSRESRKEFFILMVILIAVLPLSAIAVIGTTLCCFFWPGCPVHSCMNQPRRPIVYHLQGNYSLGSEAAYFIPEE